MSPIARTPTTSLPARTTGGSRPSRPSPSDRPLFLRARVAVRHGSLTRDLAEGAASDSSPELALRAAQLTNARGRKHLVSALRRILREVHEPRATLYRVITVNRRQVLDAEDAINSLIARLSYAEPARAKGMALAERILSDAERSPLYNAAEPGALRRDVLAATKALDTTPRAGELATAA